REMALGDLPPAVAVERLGGEADAIPEGCPVQGGRPEPARPARAHELLAIAEEKRGHRGAIQSIADGVEARERATDRILQRPSGVEYQGKDMLGIAAAFDRFVSL